jgi:multidrug resistance efflux pump
MSEKETKDQTSKPDKDEGEKNQKATAAAKPEKSPIRVFTWIVVAICALLLFWYLLANRYTPYSDQARMNALVIPIVPKVSGYLTDINVRLHSEVSENDTLFQIDKKVYELAVNFAEANVEIATQQMGFEGAGIRAAAGRLGVARAELDRAQRNSDRVQTVFIDNPEALSLYDRDATETALASAKEQVASAEADLEMAQRQLGNVEDNSNLKRALSGYEVAKLNVYYTTLKAPTKGIIESFNLEKGYYCAAGQPMATFISTSDVWIRADFPENSMENIHLDDNVDIILDIAPGRIFKGKVRSIGFGVSTEQSMNRGQLPGIQPKKGWLRPPQKFPVIISFSDEELMKHFKLGGQVDVVVYTGSNPIMNRIANFRIWFNSKLSYVR